MANQVNYFKVVTLPSSLQPSSFYFLKGAGNSRFKMYLTSDNSTPVAIELDAVPNARTISAVDGLSGGGDLSGNRSLSIDTAWMNTRYGRLAFANSWTAKNDFIHSLGIPKVAPVSPTAGVEYLHFGSIGAGGSTPPLVANLTDLQDVSISPANQATDGIVSWSVSAGKFVLGNSITGYIPVSQKAVANGVATLGSNAKIPLNQLPDAILGQVNYQGTWNAATNTPALTAGQTPKGNYYVVNTAGTRLGNTYEEGDWIISDGTKWDIVKNSDAVTTVFGRNGNIVANAGDYSAFYSQLGHTHTFESLTSKPTTVLGYGITDAYTRTQQDSRYVKKTGDTMTGDLVVMSGTDETTVSSSGIYMSRTTGYLRGENSVVLRSDSGSLFLRSGSLNSITISPDTADFLVDIQTDNIYINKALGIPSVAPTSPIAGKEYIHFGTVGSGSSTPPLVANLSDLQDVTISGATNGQVLQWNGTKWINSTIQLDMTAYALKTTRVIAGTGLSGGGSLAQDRTLSVNFGTTAGTVAQGNHTHTFASLTNKPTTILGYGITDAYTITQQDSRYVLKSGDTMTGPLTVGAGADSVSILTSGITMTRDTGYINAENLIIRTYQGNIDFRDSGNIRTFLLDDDFASFYVPVTAPNLYTKTQSDGRYGRLTEANTWTAKNTFTLGLSSSVNATAGNDVPRLSQVTTLITNATSWSQEAW